MLVVSETFVRAPLPGMEGATAITHVSPAVGAGFTQYTAEIEAAGSLGPPVGQRFVYVLEGKLLVGESLLGAGGFAYIPEGEKIPVQARNKVRAAVIEKRYQPVVGVSMPSLFTGQDHSITPSPLLEDTSIQVRSLLPSDVAFDFAVNTMTYDPGATLPMVEVHVMEHGLLMLDGGGIYRLGDQWYPVTAGDFIWMAPFCPQWFGALGKSPARYLIYKDWNRHPITGEER